MRVHRMLAREEFLAQLTKTIEAAPAAHRRALLASLDYWRLTASRVTSLDLTEAVVEGLSEEVACKLVGLEDAAA